MKKSRLALLSLVLTALAVMGTEAVTALGSSDDAIACKTVGAVGTSSATVQIPQTRVPSRYVVTAMADNLASQPFPQSVMPITSLPLSNTMNPATYNNNELGGVTDIWDTINHVASPLPSSSLTATATDPGGLVRVAVWICPL